MAALAVQAIDQGSDAARPQVLAAMSARRAASYRAPLSSALLAAQDKDAAAHPLLLRGCIPVIRNIALEPGMHGAVADDVTRDGT